MKLTKLRVQNYRSIKDSGDIPFSTIFAFIGENNSGKSNLIRSIESFMSAGAGGVTNSDFNDPTNAIIIKGEFGSLTPSEKKRWRPYLFNDNLLLEKHLRLENDERSGKDKVTAEFHGYKAEPRDWFLSVTKIEERFAGGKIDWKNIAESNNLPSYFLEQDKSTKSLFQKGMTRYLNEQEVVYDTPDLSTTQALGLQSNVVATLPPVYFLRAITDYSDEIDKRSNSTTFRRLMGDLSERILKKDPKYNDIQKALETIKSLLNKSATGGTEGRLTSIAKVEARFTELLKKLMPSVEQVSIAIVIDEMKDIFASGVSLSVNDGVDTSVLAKGHGLQRCIVFTLLQTLIMNERNQLIPGEETSSDETHHIILAIEEPELYIHPQLSKLFYDVMQEFSKTDQVIYCTHSPIFIDAFNYSKLAIIKKTDISIGTTAKVHNPDAFNGLDDQKIFRGLTRFNPAVNEMFFARRVLLVEGPEDQIAITSVLQDENIIVNRVEELDWSIIVAGGKPAIPFYQRILNSFDIPYAVLYDHDITPTMSAADKGTHIKNNKMINDLANGNPVYLYPVKLELSLGLQYHFKDQYDAHKFFENASRITTEVRTIIKSIFERH